LFCLTFCSGFFQHATFPLLRNRLTTVVTYAVPHLWATTLTNIAVGLVRHCQLSTYVGAIPRRIFTSTLSVLHSHRFRNDITAHAGLDKGKAIPTQS